MGRHTDLPLQNHGSPIKTFGDDRHLGEYIMIGQLCLTLALPVAIFSLFTSIFAKKDPVFAQKARGSSHLVTLLVSLASIMLIVAFINNSFEIEYVASYSSISLPFIYKLTGIWAGLDGSLLFWVSILVICASLVSLTKKDSSYHHINIVLQSVAIFFLTALVFKSNPFKLLPQAPLDGKGLNPLLQNSFMIFHPPALYLGYVGFTVPFAYAIALLRMKKDELDLTKWMKEVRLWVLVSWLFLTVGNLLGAMWAYVELGWGGYWAWDPVENAGILPWFTATAFLHSLTIQERRGMFKLWNATLLILTFLLTILGTFITRSGVIESVHSFSDLTIGIFFIVLLAHATFISAYLLWKRRKDIRGENSIEAAISREGAFHLNSVLLLMAMFAILWGTLLPLFSQIFTGQKVEVGPPYFNRVMAPIGILLLFLTGIGPEMSWKKARAGIFKREYLLPTILTIVAGAVAFALGIKKWFPLFTAMGSVFVLTTIIDEFIHSSKVFSMKQLFSRMPRRYGGYVVHLGIALFFIGVAGSSYQKEYRFDLVKGEKSEVAGYEFTLNELAFGENESSKSVTAITTFTKNGKPISQLKPALFLYRNQPKPSAEVDLHMTILGDVYLALASITEDANGASFVLTINPMIEFVWLGGLIVVLGTILAIKPFRRKNETQDEAHEEVEMDAVLGRGE